MNRFCGIIFLMSHVVDHINIESGMIYLERPGYYFGYGLESDPDAMESIVGSPLTAELGVIAVRQQLAVQEIDQVPDIAVEAFGNKSPQAIILGAWSKHTDRPFSSYTLIDGKNRSDLVKGTLYELEIDQAERLNEWDLAAPFFRNASGQVVYPGWRGSTTIELVDGRKVFSLATYPEQAVDRVVNGLDYNPFLNDRAITMQVIQEVMGKER
jgi:hypothetical protein